MYHSKNKFVKTEFPRRVSEDLHAWSSQARSGSDIVREDVQPEAEQELADGYHIEYSGMKFGLFFVGEYIGIVTISALMVTLFFGGWHGPFLPPFIWFALKTAFFMMMFILIRASLPRPRYDQVMSFGWKICLPLTLINLLVTAAVILWQAQ